MPHTLLPESNKGDRESPLTVIVKAVGTDLLDDVEPDIGLSPPLQATVAATTSPGLRRMGPGRGKDIEQVRLHYQSPGLLSSSSESEIKTVRSSDSCTSSVTIEPKSSCEEIGGSQRSVSIYSSASQVEISEQEPTRSTASGHNSRSGTPKTQHVVDPGHHVFRFWGQTLISNLRNHFS